jgi:4-diphosphocytidyl-2-C-methyl-D-erythritol kinase
MTKLKAYAKVNLILKVFPKQKYESKHKIISLFCLYKPLYDEICVEESKKTNIVYKQNNRSLNLDKTKMFFAVKYLSELLKKEIHLNIKIQKNIPLMSGLGGSATNVAAVMNWIAKKYQLKFTNKHLQFIALNIGSDIPFFLSGCTKAWVSDFGNKVVKTNIKTPKFTVILTNIPIDTAKAYEKMNLHYHSKVSISNAYKALNTIPFCKQAIYNDM